VGVVCCVVCGVDRLILLFVRCDCIVVVGYDILCVIFLLVCWGRVKVVCGRCISFVVVVWLLFWGRYG